MSVAPASATITWTRAVQTNDHANVTFTVTVTGNVNNGTVSLNFGDTTSATLGSSDGTFNATHTYMLWTMHNYGLGDGTRAHVPVTCYLGGVVISTPTPTIDIYDVSSINPAPVVYTGLFKNFDYMYFKIMDPNTASLPWADDGLQWHCVWDNFINATLIDGNLMSPQPDEGSVILQVNDFNAPSITARCTVYRGANTSEPITVLQFTIPVSDYYLDTSPNDLTITTSVFGGTGSFFQPLFDFPGINWSSRTIKYKMFEDYDEFTPAILDGAKPFCFHIFPRRLNASGLDQNALKISFKFPRFPFSMQDGNENAYTDPVPRSLTINPLNITVTITRASVSVVGSSILLTVINPPTEMLGRNSDVTIFWEFQSTLTHFWVHHVQDSANLSSDSKMTISLLNSGGPPIQPETTYDVKCSIGKISSSPVQDTTTSSPFVADAAQTRLSVVLVTGGQTPEPDVGGVPWASVATFTTPALPPPVQNIVFAKSGNTFYLMNQNDPGNSVIAGINSVEYIFDPPASPARLTAAASRLTSGPITNSDGTNPQYRYTPPAQGFFIPETVYTVSCSITPTGGGEPNTIPPATPDDTTIVGQKSTASTIAAGVTYYNLDTHYNHQRFMMAVIAVVLIVVLCLWGQRNLKVFGNNKLDILHRP